MEHVHLPANQIQERWCSRAAEINDVLGSSAPTGSLNSEQNRPYPLHNVSSLSPGLGRSRSVRALYFFLDYHH